jgi:hypothetical protein
VIAVHKFIVIYFLILAAISLDWVVAKLSMAETNIEKVSNFSDAPCYIEDFIRKLALDKNNPPLDREIQKLFPYLIYRDKLLTSTKKNYEPITIQDCIFILQQLKEYEGTAFYNYRSVFKLVLDSAEAVRSAMLESALISYEAKYGHIQRPPINVADVPAYEKRAKLGDLAAMFELRRYYEYPLAEDYNPEQTAARYWLFKAIEAGDEASMLEAGYDRPYSVRSELTYQNTTVAIDVACEGIDNKASPEPYPACFLYNLLIGENPGQVGHLVLDQDHLSGMTIRPQILSIIQIERQFVVELTSFADKSPEHERRDYFSLDGKYLGSNNADFFPSYFWNYHVMSASARYEYQTIDTKGSKVISRTGVRTLPYIESFLFWEIDYPVDNRLKALDDILPAEDQLYDFEKMTPEESEIISKKQLKRYNDDMLYYQRMNKIFKLDLYGTLRIANRESATLTPLEEGFTRKKSLYLKDSCQYRSPRSLFCMSYSYCNNVEAFKAYEDLKYRPTYLIKIGSNIESVRVLQICRYLEYFNTNLTYLENPYPCYALQIRKNTKYGYQYHYVINNIPSKELIESKYVIQSEIQIAKAELFDGKLYFILSSLLNFSNSLFKIDQIRLDIFDENFQYIGSNNPVLSNVMVPGFKRLPDSFAKQLDQWLESYVLSTIPDYVGYSFFVYPECADIIVEQRRHQKFFSEEVN